MTLSQGASKTPDQYLLKCSNIRALRTPGMVSRKRLILKAQRNQDDLTLYAEGAIALPADSTSADVLVFTVPSGRDAIITSVRNTWSGNGFQNGAGDLIWKYVIGGGFIMNRGNVTFQNTNTNGWTLVGSGGVYVYENQQVIVRATSGASASSHLSGGQVEAQLEGWYNPRD